MTDTIAFIADTHIGADETRFAFQPHRPQWLDAAFAGLAEVVRREGVDLVVHGGDIGHAGTAEETARAMTILGGLGTPVAACLGNHDMFGDGSYERWGECVEEAAARGLLLANRRVRLAEADVFVLNHAWLREGWPAWRWTDGTALGCLHEEQLAWLADGLAASPDRPAVIAVHQPIAPPPERLRPGASEVYPSDPPFAGPLTELIGRHPRVRLVLSGHYHATYRTDHGRWVHCSVASMTEMPFDVRIIRIGRSGMSVATVPAMPAPPDAELNPEKAWCIGQPWDRDFTLTWA
ncbi:MAG: 3',5'-cyclic adenosine monophosphate phosphodiesterase CpdA [Phycisphaerae bacterium]|nr:3',5'-cyclic adenosine monophosphate phosphodiesterase CpdA [Phycisphaerae bacterium]